MSKFLLCVFAFLLSFYVVPTFALGNNLDDGLAKSTLVLGDSDIVSVSVETIDVPNNYVYSTAFMWGGDETSPPKKIIKSISILRNGQVIFIPLSTYADLGNPKVITLEKLPARGFRLIIRGGDAAGSYSAILSFKNTEIFRRKVVSNEFPKEVWEETNFSFNHLSN